MIHRVKGNLLDSNCDYICHQVNCRGVMGSGIAKQIRDRWPEVYRYYRERYVAWRYAGNYDEEDMLGSIDDIAIENDILNRHVINMYAQSSYGFNHYRYTSYDAFEDCLYQIKRLVPVGKTIGFPKGIGCGLGGGDWNIILRMIETVLGDTHEVYIYELEE